MWREYKEHIIQDFKRDLGREDLAQSAALPDIAEHLEQRSRHLSDFPGLPQLSSTDVARLKTKLMRSELSYDAAQEFTVTLTYEHGEPSAVIVHPVLSRHPSKLLKFS